MYRHMYSVTWTYTNAHSHPVLTHINTSTHLHMPLKHMLHTLPGPITHTYTHIHTHPALTDSRTRATWLREDP